MKVNGSYSPPQFEIEVIDNGQTALISLYENVQEIERTDENDEVIATEYSFDKYTLRRRYEQRIYDSVSSNPQMWLDYAKEQEIEELSKEVRKKRDRLLLETDYTQTIDAPITTASQQEYRQYRQTLRDITEDENFPYINIWPEKPQIVKK